MSSISSGGGALPLAPSPTVLRVVKLGGAALTHKERLETLNGEVLAFTATHLASVCAGEAPGSTVIVHGAGSFGHPQASSSGVNRGGIERAEVRLGFAATRASVTLLNSHVVHALLKEGLPAVAVSPASGRWVLRNRELVSSDVQPVLDLCGVGLCPVVHGDAVLDGGQGCCILSGDVLLTSLCCRLRPPLAVFLTNVAGIYDRPPSLPGAQLVARIEVSSEGWVATCSDGREICDVQTASSAVDTTGGIATKLREAQEVALLGIEVRIAEAGTPHAVAACRSGPLPDGWTGTVIVKAGLPP